LLRICTPEAVDPALDFVDETRGDRRADYYIECVALNLEHLSLSDLQVKRLFALHDHWADAGVGRFLKCQNGTSKAWIAVALIQRGIDLDAYANAMYYLGTVCKAVPEWGPRYSKDFFGNRAKWTATVLDWWEKEGKKKYGAGD
jgi:hypothetical protein